jgi:hypothetical protein
MVVSLDRALAAGDGSPLAEPGNAGLAEAVEQALAGAGSATLVSHEEIKRRVFRLRFESDGTPRSLVAKRLAPEHARRNELVIRRWLPEVGLQDLAPELCGIAAARDASWVWHVYQDLGPFELDARSPDLERVEAVMRRVATFHARFAGHPMLAECRLHGENRDPSWFATTLRDAMCALDALRPPRLSLSDAEQELRDRLLHRLDRMLAEEPLRAGLMTDYGGPATLLHGDLWTINTFCEPADGGFRVRLVDWDRLGVGHASYDLSAFLLRFAPPERERIVAQYRAAVAGWPLPPRRELNLLFETAEWTRYANRLIWPALALVRERASWGFEELAAVEGWFEALTPVLK